MIQRTKHSRERSVLRTVLAENVVRGMAIRWPASRNRPRALADHSGLSLSSVQRICSGDVGATLDSIEAIARALQTTVLALLTPSDEVRRLLAVQPEATPQETTAEHRELVRGREGVRLVAPRRHKAHS